MRNRESTLRVFGQRLRTIRLARGWTQEELADRAGRHWTYIGGLERGERNATLVVLCDLAAALDISPAELLEAGHPLTAKVNASATDILDAIEKGFRALIDVKGKLAELYMNRQLDALRAAGAMESITWQDVDGKPDFVVRYRRRDLSIECK